MFPSVRHAAFRAGRHVAGTKGLVDAVVPPYPPDAPEGAQIAKHYTGWAPELESRLADHAAGRGARLTQVQLAVGGSWRLASA